MVADAVKYQSRHTTNSLPYSVENQYRILGNSGATLHTLEEIGKVAPTTATVLILGESGTGKELVARTIHRESKRSSFVPVNCSALPAELLESELFGHERGAFTGAVTSYEGKFEQAHGGTIYLDEIADMPQILQAKILRTLQDGVVTPIGSSKEIRLNVRVIAATNRDLEAEVTKRNFRSDLYYRLNIFPIYVAPLRERTEDIGFLAEIFYRRYCVKYYGREDFIMISPDALDTLQSYRWPGNIRELENLMARLAVLNQGKQVILKNEDLAGLLKSQHNKPANHDLACRTDYAGENTNGESIQIDLPPDSQFISLAHVAQMACSKVEKALIQRYLAKNEWNRRAVARQLGISYKTLFNKLKALGIQHP